MFRINQRCADHSKSIVSSSMASSPRKHHNISMMLDILKESAQYSCTQTTYRMLTPHTTAKATTVTSVITRMKKGHPKLVKNVRRRVSLCACAHCASHSMQFERRFSALHFLCIARNKWWWNKKNSVRCVERVQHSSNNAQKK